MNKGLSKPKPIQTQKPLDKVSKWALFKVAKGIFYAGGFAVCLLAGVSIVGVIGRRSPLAGPWLMSGIEIAMLTLAVITVLAGAYVWYIKGHVRVGLIRDNPRFGQRAKAVMDTVASAVFLFWVVGISIGSVRMAATSLSVGEATSTSRIPLSPFQIVFVVLLIHFAFVLLRSTGLFVSKAAGRNLDRDIFY